MEDLAERNSGNSHDRAVCPGRQVVTVATDVTVRLDGGVAVLCLDGAERMNAIGSHTYRALGFAAFRERRVPAFAARQPS